MKDKMIPNAGTLRIRCGQSAKISCTGEKQRTECKNLTYVSSDSSVAEVGQDGTVVAVGEGYAFITALGELGSCRIAVSCLPVKDIYTTAPASNPYLPCWEYVPDGEPYIFEDPDRPGHYRVYVYGSHDSACEKMWCGYEQVVWSAPVEDLTQWRYGGVVFQTERERDEARLFAPDMAEVITADGKKEYYFYPNPTSERPYYRVAKSHRPDGPFLRWDPAPMEEADQDLLCLDPAVFVDDDGRIYGYWGYLSDPMWAEMDPETMGTVKKGTVPQVNVPGINDIKSENFDPTRYNVVQDEHVRDWRFFEASSLRKIGNKYVFLYARTGREDEATGTGSGQLAYGYSDSPKGPWKYGGVIVRCGGEWVPAEDGGFADTYPQTNTHGSLCCVNGQWYIFYHRGMQGIRARQATVEAVTVDWDETPVSTGGQVRIGFAEMTSKGFAINGLDPFQTYSAHIASYFVGKAEFRHTYDRAATGIPVRNIQSGTVAGYKYFCFDEAGNKKPALRLALTPKCENGRIDVFLRPKSGVNTGLSKENGEVTSVGLGSVKVGALSWQQKKEEKCTLTLAMPDSPLLKEETGVFLVFYGAGEEPVCDLHTISFVKEWEE